MAPAKVFLVIISGVLMRPAMADMKLQTIGASAIKPATVLPVTVPTVTSPVVNPVVTPQTPYVYGNPAAAAAAKASGDKQQQQQQMMQKMIQSLGQGGGAGAGSGGVGGANDSNGGGSSQGYKPTSASSGAAPSGQGGFQYAEPGKIDSCPTGTAIPPKVTQALQQAKDFRDKCSAANRGATQKIAINDYSCEGTPKMWIFDTQGHCISSTAITFGSGGGKSSGQSCPLACAEKEGEMTPPGFHLTGYHPQSQRGKQYGPTDSMELVALEGQRSHERGILLHKAAAPGTASSWGCTGVCQSCYDQIAKTLGYGALVYNYFGDRPQSASGCSTQAGLSHGSSCSVEAGSTIPNGAPQTGAESAQ